jgi:hypothetical protein
MNRWELEQKLVIKALKDPAFKKKLFAQPKEAVREFLKNEKGIDFSILDKVNFRVVEEKNNECVITMPSMKEPGDTLTEEEMSSMAAGTTFQGYCG